MTAEPVQAGALATAGSPAAALDRQPGTPAAFSDPLAWTRLDEAENDEDFAAAWLALQCGLIGSVRAGVVVLRGSGGDGFRPVAFQSTGGAGSPDEHPALAAVAELAVEHRRGVVGQRPADPPGAAPAGEQKSRSGSTAVPSSDPARVDALAWPIISGDDLAGAVALEIPRASDERLRIVMRLLQWGSAWWERRFARLTPASDRASADQTKVLDVLAAALEDERFLASATAAVTGLAGALDCERVAYGTRAGRHAQVSALSHTANFNKKTALIRALAAAMDEALDQQQTVVLPPPEGTAPQVDRASRELVERHGSRAVCVVPLGQEGRVLGAITLERAGELPFTPAEVALAEHAGVLLGPVLEARRRDDRWIGAKLWDAMRGLAGDLLGPGHLGLKLAALVLAGLSVFFSLATETYRISAPAALEGTVQRAVTAPTDGYIAEALVRAGDPVRAGEPLAALEDKDLRLEKVQWEAEREKVQREYSRALAAGERAQVRILAAQADQAEARIALLADQLARVRIRAPFDGVVVSGDLSQALGTPVSRGDVLFEIAPLDSWRVALQVDERDISALAVGQTGALALAGKPGEPLAVRVTKITPVASAADGRNSFRAEAALEGGDGALRPGMQGIAKIDVNERSLLWIWTHKLVYWLRLWWWSWWP